jgi:hypothetical protein
MWNDWSKGDIHIQHNDDGFAILMANIKIILNLAMSKATTNKEIVNLLIPSVRLLLKTI